MIHLSIVALAVLALAPLSGAEATAAPTAQGYLYIEPYQARYEALFDAATILRWQNPQAELPARLSPDAQKTLTDAIAAKASGWCEVHSAGQPLPGAFIGASVIKGKPGNTLPLEPSSDLALDEALVGLIWEFPTPPAPEDITVTWKGFESLPAIPEIPIRVFFGPLSENLTLTSSATKTTWQSQGRVPSVPPLASVPLIISGPLTSPLWGYFGLAWIVLGLAALILIRRKGWPMPGGIGFGIVIWFAIGSAFMVIDRVARQANHVATPAQAQAILHPLLRNVYRAFDHRAESEIYDVLARSVDGELLRRLYLETIQALTLDGREGTRVTINDFDATVAAVRPNPAAPGFIADCQWTALGRVGHWGHTHTRVNRYTAQVTVTPRGPDWKITGLEVTETRRL
ncbi:MAG: hypothetical protein U0984_02080 [Prosthecobacter sp.]|nr:hypothetical protein [Prosthecobacter sp.]